MKEEWKDVKGYEGLYQVSSYGRVRSIERVVKHRGFDRLIKERMLAERKSSKGYIQYRFYNGDGGMWYPKAHTLVATHFLTNPNNFEMINHKDEVKDNNHVDNLEWCTSQYNNEYSLKNRYYFKSPEGITMKIKNLTRFCRENNLTSANMYNVHKGKRPHHKGWTKWER
jgi:hypothetical protein